MINWNILWNQNSIRIYSGVKSKPINYKSVSTDLKKSFEKYKN